MPSGSSLLIRTVHYIWDSKWEIFDHRKFRYSKFLCIFGQDSFSALKLKVKAWDPDCMNRKFLPTTQITPFQQCYWLQCTKTSVIKFITYFLFLFLWAHYFLETTLNHFCHAWYSFLLWKKNGWGSSKKIMRSEYKE